MRVYAAALFLIAFPATHATEPSASSPDPDDCLVGAHTGAPVAPEANQTNVVITVFWFDDLDELRASIEDVEGDTCGYSECDINEDHNLTYCYIYVVRPSKVDDHWTNTLGHEVLHGLWGDYHGE